MPIETFKYLNYDVFNAFNEKSSTGISYALKRLHDPHKKPVIVCVGSDLVLGDSLGPLVGTFLNNKKVDAYVYGSLACPITAKEIGHIKSFLKKTHPKSFVIAVDAAVGNFEDVGVIKTYKESLKPGLGVDKKLGEIGDCSVIGIVCEKSQKNNKLYNYTRLNLVYKMAEIIAYGIEKYISDGNESQKSFF